MKTWRDRARETMRRKKISQGQMAEALGLAQPTVSAKLGGRRETTVDEVAAFAEKLGVEPAWLAFGVQTVAEPDTAEMLADLTALPEGWRYYIRRKTRQLRAVANSLPEFLRDTLRVIPEDANYWRWERSVEEYVRQSQGVIEDDGYLGPERRHAARLVAHERRGAYDLTKAGVKVPAPSSAKTPPSARKLRK